MSLEIPPPPLKKSEKTFSSFRIAVGQGIVVTKYNMNIKATVAINNDIG